jgi:zinc finger protein-like protein
MWVFNLLSVFQVFPLLTKKFSHKEQADLVWQFLCSIPVNMMAKFLPWLSDSVSPDEHQDIVECLWKVVPEENLLQEVVMIIPITYLLSLVLLFFTQY